MYEHRHEPLLPSGKFLLRVASHAAVALAVVLGSLIIGIVGYHVFEGLDWVDGLLNAAMLLGGMGPVNAPQTEAGKIFASLYALYAGLVFLIVAGVLFAPLFHRFVHHFHLELAEDQT
jgi:hypothetical protein